MATNAKKAATPAKKATKAAEDFAGITAYNVKTKEKNVPMHNAVINIKSGRFIASGTSESGDKLTSILNGAKAQDFIDNGHAEKGEGWPDSKPAAALKKAAKKA